MSLGEVLDVRIFGEPVAQGRARARVFEHAGRARVSMYDPANARDWKRTVLGQVLPVKPPAPVDGALAMRVTFFLRRPQSLPKREQHPVKRPDLSNLLKAVEDALQGVVYRDDSQIIRLDVEKRYDPAPGARITVARLLDAPITEPSQALPLLIR